jgi:cytochrome b561
MGVRNSRTGYGAIAQTLHWIVAVLLLAQFPLGFVGADLPVGLDRLITLSRHKALGMTLFALMAARLAWRLFDPPPPLPAQIPALERRLAGTMHLLLYGLLLALPMAGWIASSASNLTVSWFGWFTFPDLVDTDPALARSAKIAHRVMAWLLLACIVVHVAAALRHHFVRSDGVLARMLPRRTDGAA